MFKLFSTNCHGASVDTYVQGETFDTQTNKGIPYLDVTSVYNKERGSVFVNVINRHADKAITADLSNITTSFAGKAQVSSIEGDLSETFTHEKEDSYIPKVKQIDIKNGIVTYSFPAHSITQIEVRLK
jgi:alpha-N-arabinofuranosidase